MGKNKMMPTYLKMVAEGQSVIETLQEHNGLKLIQGYSIGEEKFGKETFNSLRAKSFLVPYEAEEVSPKVYQREYKAAGTVKLRGIGGLIDNVPPNGYFHNALDGLRIAKDGKCTHVSVCGKYPDGRPIEEVFTVEQAEHIFTDNLFVLSREMPKGKAKDIENVSTRTRLFELLRRGEKLQRVGHTYYVGGKATVSQVVAAALAKKVLIEKDGSFFITGRVSVKAIGGSLHNKFVTGDNLDEVVGKLQESKATHAFVDAVMGDGKDIYGRFAIYEIRVALDGYHVSVV